MKLKISHVTTYHYDEAVDYSLHQIRLTPKSRPEQKVIGWETEIEGGQLELEFEDQHNNHVILASVKDGQTALSVRSMGEVETTNTNGVIGEHGGFAPLWYFTRSTPQCYAGPNVANLVEDLSDSYADDIERMHALSGLIAKRVTYQTGITHSETTAEEALGNGQGVCQDHAHIFATACRLMDYPARYVSGYLMMDDRIDQDATHAWAEVYLTGLGWVGFDASNDISPDERYVRIATGLDYQDAAPISGLRFGDSAEEMRVSLQVQQ